MIAIDTAHLGLAPRDIYEKSHERKERLFIAMDTAYVEYYIVDEHNQYVRTIGYDKITLQ